MYNKIVPVVLLCFMLFLSSACERSEIEERYFSNYQQLGASGEPGNWVPSFIPHSAVEIRAKFKIDTGAELLRFHFDDANDDYLVGYCDKAKTSDIEYPSAGFLDVDWWPSPLLSNHSKSEEIPRYEIYRCERQAFLAVTQEDGSYQAFYWRISMR